MYLWLSTNKILNYEKALFLEFSSRSKEILLRSVMYFSSYSMVPSANFTKTLSVGASTVNGPSTVRILDIITVNKVANNLN
jgi:hypothetical protein